MNISHKVEVEIYPTNVDWRENDYRNLKVEINDESIDLTAYNKDYNSNTFQASFTPEEFLKMCQIVVAYYEDKNR